MGYQSEAELENQLIKQLNEQGYKSVTIKDYDSLLANFREHFYNFNKEKFGSVGLFFENLDSLITLHQRKLEAMKEYKKGLLQQMFV